MNKESRKNHKDHAPLPNQTKGVKTLLGDPKKAIIKLAVPMIIAMSVQTIYNFVDALFVSGLGAHVFTHEVVADTGAYAIAAIGFVLPFFMMAIAISTGVGAGSSAALARRIGAQDKTGADTIATHSIILSILIALTFTITLFFSIDHLLYFIGAGEALPLAVTYGRIIFAGSINIFFINIATALLRGEGDAKRAMYAIMIGTVLNIILDPLFIFTFRLGVAGAAYATVLSMSITSLLLIYWFFLRKNTYVTFTFTHFTFKKDILLDIFRVGLPASIQQLSMSITMLLINLIIIHVALAGDNGITIYTIGWRIVALAILPMLGLATAIVSVTGAAYGAQDMNKLNISYMYSIKIGFFIEIVLALCIFLLAPLITTIFTTGPGLDQLKPDIELFIQISCFFYPGAAFGIASSAMFQGTGKGTYSLIATLLRTIILTVVLAIFFSYIFDPAIIGIWWAIVVANLIGSAVSFSWAKIYIHRLFNTSNIPG